MAIKHSQSEHARIRELKARITHEISAAGSDLLKSYPVQHHIDALDSYAGYGEYSYFPDTLQRSCEEVARRTNTTTLENYNKLLMLTLMESFGTRAAHRRLPASINRLFSAEFDRMIHEMEDGRQGYYMFPKDAFLKDLGLCRLKLYPCGAELIDERSGIPRSVLIRGGMRQLLRAAVFFFVEVNGFRPYYELHMHAPYRPEFNAGGWILTYRRIAELLQLNPGVKGVSCISWWYDPQVATISPRLKYLREQPMEGGAEIFYMAPDPEAAYGAVEKSKTRKTAYESGDYVPALYLMVWARKDLIRWATQFVTD